MVDDTVLLSLHISVETRRVTAPRVALLELQPPWIPAGLLPAADVSFSQVCVAKERVFLLYHTGVVTIHTLSTGTCVALVDIPAHTGIHRSSWSPLQCAAAAPATRSVCSPPL